MQLHGQSAPVQDETANAYAAQPKNGKPDDEKENVVMQGRPQLHSKLTLEWGDNPKTESILGRNKEEFGFCSHTGAGERQLPPAPQFQS